MEKFSNSEGRGILLEMVDAIQKNKQYLGDIDGLIGDGDHGANMNLGFTTYKESLGDEEVSFSDGLFDLGSVLLNKIGGSMGPIYGTLFMAMSEEAEDLTEIGIEDFARMLRAGLDGLYEIVDARPGDKTLVDTLYPAVVSLESYQGNDMEEALTEMKEAAKNGWESTKELQAKYGRSSRLGERSIGVLDAGATSCYLILSAMADGIIKL